MSAEAYARAIFLEEVYSADFDNSFPKEWIEFDRALNDLRHLYDMTFLNLGFSVSPNSESREKDVAFILSSDAFEKDGDEYTGMWVLLNVKKKDDVINIWAGRNPEANRLKKLGAEARVRAISKSAAELGWQIDDPEKLRSDAIANASLVDPIQIPASDRVVTRTDNQDVIQEIEDALEEVSQLIQTDNEVGSELADGREIINLELQVAKDITRAKAFRVSSLLGWLTPALRFLAEKFASGAIGEAAKRLLQLLIDLL